MKGTTNGQLPPVSPDAHPSARLVTQSEQGHWARALSCKVFHITTRFLVSSSVTDL